MKVNKIYETKDVEKYLIKRNLLKQYLKAVENILNGNFGKLDFKKRQPKKDEIWSFRVNKQYRAIGYFREKNVFIVVKIYDHQE